MSLRLFLAYLALGVLTGGALLLGLYFTWQHDARGALGCFFGAALIAASAIPRKTDVR